MRTAEAAAQALARWLLDEPPEYDKDNTPIGPSTRYDKPHTLGTIPGTDEVNVVMPGGEDEGDGIEPVPGQTEKPMSMQSIEPIPPGFHAFFATK